MAAATFGRGVRRIRRREDAIAAAGAIPSTGTAGLGGTVGSAEGRMSVRRYPDGDGCPYWRAGHASRRFLDDWRTMILLPAQIDPDRAVS
jgi:hypothetical protein